MVLGLLVVGFFNFIVKLDLFIVNLVRMMLLDVVG